MSRKLSRFSVSLGILLGLVVLATPLHAGSVWDLAADFNTASNTATDTWQYSFKSGTDVVLLPNQLAPFNGLTGMDGWGGTFWVGIPFVLKNTSESAIDLWGAYGGTVPAGEIVLHPWTEEAQGDTVVSWLCPQTGLYDVAGSIYIALDPRLDEGDGIVWNLSLGNPYTDGTSLASGAVARADDTPEEAGIIAVSGVSIAAGDMLYFTQNVGAALDPACDASILSLTITEVPEPGTLVLILVGLASMALCRRVR